MIHFELRDKQTVMPLDDQAAHWSSYIGEVIRGVHLYYPSWLKVPKERKAAIITDIVVIDPTTETYNVEKIRWEHPENITGSEWDKYIQFWNDPRNIARAAQNRQNPTKSTVISRHGSRSLACLRDEMSSTTQEYPSLIDTFFVAHTVNGEFFRDEDRRIYEETRMLEDTGTYIDDEINCLARGGKQRGHIPGAGRVLPARATASPSMSAHESTLNSLHKKGGASGNGGCEDDEEDADHQDDEDEDDDAKPGKEHGHISTGSRSLARLRDKMRQSSTTQEYSLLIDTFFVAHTVNGEFLRDEDDVYTLEATSTYTDDEINRLARGGKQRGHIPGVGRVLPARATASPSTPTHESTHNNLHKEVDFMMTLFKSDSKYSDMFSQFESVVPVGVAGARTRRRVPTIRTTRMRMAMAILSCVIYGSFPGDMSPGNMCHRDTYFLTEKYVGPTVSLGIVAGEGIPCERSPANIPRRQVAGKAVNCRWGRGLML
nr:F-box domain, leucine-rich repeat domain, L domain-like protein [Tanacetum cinerariifolium]